jgi:hypothetical protein
MGLQVNPEKRWNGPAGCAIITLAAGRIGQASSVSNELGALFFGGRYVGPYITVY